VYGLAAANEKQEKAVSIKSNLEQIFEKYKSSINADLANSVFSFYANKAKEGENDAAYAILRIAKGLAGVLVAALGATLLVLSGGAAAPVAAILGAASSFIYFLGIMAKVIMDTKKFYADQSQREAYLKLVNPGQDQLSTPATEIDYSNRYIMVHKFAEAIVDGQKTEGEFPLTEILSAMSFTKLDMELLWGMLDRDVTRIEKTCLIEIVLAKKMGIV
jgi:predicted lipid-binding transport protein (Tim44 family)